jgi:hypothetical protein
MECANGDDPWKHERDSNVTFQSIAFIIFTKSYRCDVNSVVEKRWTVGMSSAEIIEAINSSMSNGKGQESQK